jgi:hypothetical protein
MDVTYFRPRRDGPESAIVTTVAHTVPDLLEIRARPLWIAGSLPIGAGMPDLVIVSCQPKIVALARTEVSSAQILAYLRVVRRASAEKITERLGRPQKVIFSLLDSLLEVNAVIRDSNAYSLSPEWREILPEVVTIEAKVKDWRRAVQQASRNRIFAHRSFIALPNSIANRVQQEPTLGQLGIGLISVDEETGVILLREARRHQPKVWSYYYELAMTVASHYKV